MPASFVSFKTRWGAAVCAQTQQSRNPTLWLTDWAPEPRDVYWNNLAIPYVSLTIRKLIIAVAFFFLTFFFMIPIAFVQTLASLEGIRKKAPFLKVIIDEWVPHYILVLKSAPSLINISFSWSLMMILFLGSSISRLLVTIIRKQNACMVFGGIGP